MAKFLSSPRALYERIGNTYKSHSNSMVGQVSSLTLIIAVVECQTSLKVAL